VLLSAQSFAPPPDAAPLGLLPSTFPLNPEVQALLDLPAVRDRERIFAEPWEPERVQHIIGELRESAASEAKAFPVAEVFDRALAGTGVRIYRAAPDVQLPVIVFFHGGGWVFGDLDTQDNICRSIANTARAAVVSVDYGLAPENPFPGPVNQAITVTRQIIIEAEELSVDPDRITVAGASAGGNLAAAVAVDAASHRWANLRGQVLAYPPLDATTALNSYTDNASGYNLSAAEMRFYWHMYHQGRTDLRDPRLSPLFADDVSGLPPTLMLTAEFDVVRDEDEAFAARLADAGVPVHVRRYGGQIHGFLGHGHLNSDSGHGLHEMGLWLRERLWDN
jgi:acetyl esterase